MIKLTMVSVFLMACVLANGQNLSIDQLLALRLKDFEYVDKYLASKNWVFQSSKKVTDSSIARVSYSYVPDTNTDKFTILSFYKKKSSLTDNRILLQFEDFNYFKTSNSRISALGFELFSNKIDDNNIVKVYHKKGIVFEVSTISQNEQYRNQTMYEILIATFDDYWTNLRLKY